MPAKSLPTPDPRSGSFPEMAWIRWKLDNLNMHQDPIAEAVKQLAGSIQELACAMRQIALGAEKNAILTRLEGVETKIMSKLTEWADQQEADLTGISGTLDEISTDIKNLDKMISDFQNSPGTLTPEDQARLDKIEKTIKGLSVKAKEIRADSSTPPNPENPPSDVPTP